MSIYVSHQSCGIAQIFGCSVIQGHLAHFYIAATKELLVVEVKTVSVISEWPTFYSTVIQVLMCVHVYHQHLAVIDSE